MKEVKKNSKTRRTKQKEKLIARKIKNENSQENLIAEIKGPNLEEFELEIKKDITPKKKKPILCLFLFFLLIISFVFLHLSVPKVNLNGPNLIELSYQDEYQELGATAEFFGKDLTSKIQIDSNMNLKKIGTYQVIYSLKDGIFHIQKERTVKIIDNVSPIIELTGEK